MDTPQVTPRLLVRGYRSCWRHRDATPSSAMPRTADGGRSVCGGRIRRSCSAYRCRRRSTGARQESRLLSAGLRRTSCSNGCATSIPPRMPTASPRLAPGSRFAAYPSPASTARRGHPVTDPTSANRRGRAGVSSAFTAALAATGGHRRGAVASRTSRRRRPGRYRLLITHPALAGIGHRRRDAAALDPTAPARRRAHRRLVGRVAGSEPDAGLADQRRPLPLRLGRPAAGRRRRPLPLRRLTRRSWRSFATTGSGRTPPPALGCTRPDHARPAPRVHADQPARGTHHLSAGGGGLFPCSPIGFPARRATTSCSSTRPSCRQRWPACWPSGLRRTGRDPADRRLLQLRPAGGSRYRRRRPCRRARRALRCGRDPARDAETARGRSHRRGSSGSPSP